MADLTEVAPRDQEIDVFGVSDVGKVREENEDRFLVASLHKMMKVWNSSFPADHLRGLTSDSIAFLMMVADGVGGNAAGEKASETALEAVAQYVALTVNAYYNLDIKMEDAFLKDLEVSVERCHEAVCAEADRNPRHHGMATTLTMATLIWPRAYVVQVGDSRCYQLRNGELRQLTTDQTMAQAMIDQGVPRENVNGSRLEHILSSAIGSELAPVTTKFEVRRDDVLMLCSDGLTNHLSDEDIRERLLHCATAQEACHTLVSEAIDRGGSDNVTVVVGRIK